MWLRKDNGSYYTTIRGEQVKLSKDPKEAKRLFHVLMAKEQEPGTLPQNSVPKWT